MLIKLLKGKMGSTRALNLRAFKLRLQVSVS